jgi:hypothetical protein
MPLSEEQIQRYARHILLPEVGGVGQEKLLATEVHLAGESALVELAGEYLSAAGVRVDAHSGRGLALSIREGAQVVVRAEAGRVLVLSGCRACVGEPAGPIPFESGAIAASLAASECLRMILRIGEPARAWEIRGAKLSHLAPIKCAHRAAS